ncbi:hypothetical protein MtrunA17_Chr6g0482451 [Medicago truncatula]|uniref:Uncharacterized protein n=1 Tax=Medicago truncatula TaxID=3880 RepID=A0A396HMN9_MEDTR|nr:hypothetical protein MtrunA17_Chr6g0482451 [Medicago truncatula]
MTAFFVEIISFQNLEQVGPVEGVMSWFKKCQRRKTLLIEDCCLLSKRRCEVEAATLFFFECPGFPQV